MPKDHSHVACKHSVSYCQQCDEAYCTKCEQVWLPPCAQTHMSYTYTTADNIHNGHTSEVIS